MITIRELFELTRTSHGRAWLQRTARKRFYSRHESVCLRKDLSDPYIKLPAKIPTTVRQLRPDDDLSLIADEPGLTPEEAKLRRDQRWLLNCDLPTPWVAIDPDGMVAMMVYLLTAEDNACVRKLWRGWLPEIQPDEVMVEGFYTAEKYRGLGVMPDAGARIIQHAADAGKRYGVGFILFGNSSSRRAGEKGGWLPHIMREERWILFHRRIRFLPLSDAARDLARARVAS